MSHPPGKVDGQLVVFGKLLPLQLCASGGRRGPRLRRFSTQGKAERANRDKALS
jgi:hypothetical protein